jgi:hypothetical protein
MIGWWVTWPTRAEAPYTLVSNEKMGQMMILDDYAIWFKDFTCNGDNTTTIHGYYAMNWFIISYYDKEYIYSPKPKAPELEIIKPPCLPDYIQVRTSDK